MVMMCMTPPPAAPEGRWKRGLACALGAETRALRQLMLKIVPRRWCLGCRKTEESGGLEGAVTGEEEEPEITAEGKSLLTSSCTGQAVPPARKPLSSHHNVQVPRGERAKRIDDLTHRVVRERLARAPGPSAP